MISCPCGRICAGRRSSCSLSQPVTCNAVIEESIQVSRTSVSGSNSVEPQIQAFFGAASFGSIGSQLSSEIMTSPHCLQYQIGIGVAKILCLEMHQSHSIVPVQFWSLTFIYSGYQLISSAAFRMPSGLILTNHWGSERISIGVSQRQQSPTFCSRGVCLYRKPAVFRSEMTASLQSVMLMPSYLLAAFAIFPCLSIAFTRGSPYFSHQRTSCLSPKVQIITAPVPNSGSTASSAIRATFCPKMGTVMVWPMYRL